MTQRLHLAFRGEPTDPQATRCRNGADIHVAGIFRDGATAYAAWKAEARRTVDYAQLHRLQDAGAAASSTEEPGS